MGNRRRGYTTKMPISLTARERTHLKGRAHALEPTVFVGHAGVSDAVVAETERALVAHELIKVRIDASDREARAALGDALCTRTGAVAVQRVGKVIVLWRPAPADDGAADAD